MAGFFIALALFTATDHRESGVAREHCSLIELNHLYDNFGKLERDQLIFWDWSDSLERYLVRDFRKILSPAMIPQRDWQRGGYFVIWTDLYGIVNNESVGIMRHISSSFFVESWTQYDPEIENQKFLPKSRRRGLIKPPKLPEEAPRVTPPPPLPMPGLFNHIRKPPPKKSEMNIFRFGF